MAMGEAALAGWLTAADVSEAQNAGLLYVSPVDLVQTLCRGSLTVARGEGVGAVGSPLMTYRGPSVLRISDSTNQGQGDPVVVTVGKTRVLADLHDSDPRSRVSSNLPE